LFTVSISAFFCRNSAAFDLQWQIAELSFGIKERMLRRISSLFVVALLTAGSAYSQEAGLGAGRIEIGAFPGGGLVFQESGKGAEPDFANYALGGTFTLNVNRYFGIEGEAGGSLGIKQNLSTVEGVTLEEKTPNTWLYMGNAVLNPLGNDRTLVPYAAGGVGGLTLLDVTGEDAPVTGLARNETYLMGNVGGGLKWFASRHVGLRADYRFFMVKGKDAAPAFFGVEDRFGHRVTAGLLLTY
jgi:Outer membrane protein beta-barrel domain